MQIDPHSLAEGERRLPYFYIHGRAVLCPACAAKAPRAKEERAVYTASRLYRCSHCLVWIGPANASEEKDG